MSTNNCWRGRLKVTTPALLLLCTTRLLNKDYNKKKCKNLSATRHAAERPDEDCENVWIPFRAWQWRLLAVTHRSARSNGSSHDEASTRRWIITNTLWQHASFERKKSQVLNQSREEVTRWAHRSTSNANIFQRFRLHKTRNRGQYIIAPPNPPDIWESSSHHHVILLATFKDKSHSFTNSKMLT